MRFLSEVEYNKRLNILKRKNKVKLRKQQLRLEKNKYKKKIALPSTSKLMAFYLFFFFNVITVYAMVAMWHFQDLSYLGVLVTDLASQVLVYLIYSVKALKENSAGGITYDLAMTAQNDDSSVG